MSRGYDEKGAFFSQTEKLYREPMGDVSRLLLILFVWVALLCVFAFAVGAIILQQWT